MALHIQQSTQCARCSADCAALAAEHLAHTRDVLDADKFIVVTQVVFLEGCAGDTQFRIFFEALHEKREIVGLKGNVRVKVANHVVLQVAESRNSRAHGKCLARKTPLVTLGHLYQVDPGAIRSILPDEFFSVIRRAVVYDHPFRRRHGLRGDRFQGHFNKARLIARRRD